jgi:3D (Asp-Asp-Asp) domain-containing protein
LIFKTKQKFILYTISFCVLALGTSACEFGSGLDENKYANAEWQTMNVSASAYNSVTSQTEGNPFLTAWGDTLEPGMKAIAVSRDLIKKGLDYNTPVRIEGMDGLFFVKDKMHYRWKNKIDIYMGQNVKKARKWGRKKVQIHFVSMEEGELPED